MKEIRIGAEDAGQRFDKFLRRYLREAGDGFIYRMLRKKRIKLNGARSSGRDMLNADDVVSFYLSDETIEKFRGISARKDETAEEFFQDSREAQDAVPGLSAEEIVYEDDDILVMDKPAGELSQKSSPDDISLNERMLAYLGRSKALSPYSLYTPGIANRLDRNTSGIVLAGKTLFGMQLLTELIRERKIRKFYLATVEGDMPDTGGWTMIHGFLTKDHAANRVTIYDEPGAGRTEIHTAYRVVEGGSVKKGQTCLEIELITGKTHQIRAHLASIGHPLSGDRKYGSHAKGKYELRAYRVVFPDDERLSASIRGRELTLQKFPKEHLKNV